MVTTVLGSIGIAFSLWVLFLVLRSANTRCAWCFAPLYRIRRYQGYCHECGERICGEGGLYLQNGSSPYKFHARSSNTERVR
jgi:predicted amidophosphoribosyltransferase